VPLPTPEGPEITMGRRSVGTGEDGLEMSVRKLELEELGDEGEGRWGE